jgi:hypothetical protein
MLLQELDLKPSPLVGEGWVRGCVMIVACFSRPQCSA